jgi:MFS family permease
VSSSRDLTPPSLWRDRRFLRFWTGQSISQFGDRISELALPLIAVSLHVGATQVAVLTALIWTPNLLAAFLGTWVDQQRRKRRLMVVADLVRTVALASLPGAYLLGTVTLAQLYVVAVITGAFGVLFNNAYSTFFAHLVPRSAYIEANSKLSTSRSASYVVGPAIAGVLIQVLTAPVAVVADALSFLASALLVGRISVDEPEVDSPDASEGSMIARSRQGLTFIVCHRILRSTIGCCTTVNFFTFVGYGLTVFFASHTLRLSAGTIGLAFGAGAVGSLLGAVVAPRVSRRFGVGPTILLGAVLYPAPVALIAVAGGPEWLRWGALTAAEFIGGLGVMFFDINLNSLEASVIPDSMRSRVSGAYNTVNYGIRPLGALAGGLLGSLIGIRPTLLIGAIGGTLCVLWLLPSPIRGIRTLELDGSADNAADAVATLA